MPPTPLAFKIIGLIWFYGWGFMLLKYPNQAFRMLSWGLIPDQRTRFLQRSKVAGYFGLVFGTLFLIEWIFGAID
jgi:hypothetical protein